MVSIHVDPLHTCRQHIQHMYAGTAASQCRNPGQKFLNSLKAAVGLMGPRKWGFVLINVKSRTPGRRRGGRM